MKGRITCLLVSCLFILFLMLTACSSPSPEEPEPTLTEAEAAQMKERGMVNVSTVEDASRIAGYPVAMPAYIPEGFHGGSISVSKPHFMLPQEESRVFPMRVERIWTCGGSAQGKRQAMFVLTQTPEEFGISGGEPAEVCGVAGERAFKDAEPDMPAKLTLYWRHEDMSYCITGLLADPLDEDTLEKIACSVGTD